MHVLVAAFGTRGDVQPAAVVAQALRSRGHSCSVFVPPNLVDWVRGLGLEATAVGLDYARVSRAASEGRFLDLLRVLPLLRVEVDAQVDAMAAAASRADLFLGCSVFAAGRLLAEHHRRPYRFLALSPFLIPSSEHPAPMVRSQRLPRWLNRLSWAFNELLWGAFLRGPINRRRRALGLGAMGRVWDSLLADVTLLAAEPSLFPLAAQLPTTRKVLQTGALFLDDEATPLSPALETFLDAGAPPLFVGFGSMSDPNPARTTRRLAEAARRCGRRLIIARGWAGLSLDQTPDDVFLSGPEPHAKVFPRCAAVIHHGGIGTAHAAARAGVPQLVLPHLLDQYYTAHRLELAGVGLGLRDRFGADTETLAKAFTQVLEPGLATRARALAERVRLDGGERAIAVLERG
jgi:UDP:flavonoid glycosyltransferase YjiC (YdhE family)